MNGSSDNNIPLRNSAILKVENDDKHCFLGSILASRHPCTKSQPNRVTNYGY